MASINLDSPIYHFNGIEPFTLRQAFEGTHISGGIGSGKSSGSASALAKAFLREGMGGLVLTVKPTDTDDWISYAKETGREDSLLIFDASGDWRFPFLQYEVNRPGKGAGYTENIVRLFTTVYEAMERGRGGAGGDPYWTRSMESLLRNSVDLCLLANGEVSVPLIYDIIISAPSNPEERDSEEWRKNSQCWLLLSQANSRQRDEWEQYDFDSTVTFWLEEFCNLAPKTRSGVVSMATSMMTSFLRRPFRMLFSEPSANGRNAVPELTFEGVVIVLNLPVKVFGEAGKSMQMVYKYLWQQAVERRNTQQSPRPVFLFIDEAQNYVSDFDMQFQATARSSRCCTVYISQNLPNYLAELGNKHRVDSLMGNMITRIWHNNSDPETNTQASETIGRSWQQRKGKSVSAGADNFSAGNSVQESFDYDIIPQTFSKNLRKGGPLNHYEVDGIIFQSGRQWSNGQNYLYATFNQQNT
jgi:hypothetical protein